VLVERLRLARNPTLHGGAVISIAPLGTGAIWTIRSSSYSPALHKEAKATPGLRWDPSGRWWCGAPDAVQACAQRLKARGIRFEGADQLATARYKLVPRLKTGWADKLRDYQKEGVRFLITQAEEGALLADDLGIGKSLQALRAARLLEVPTVVVCPAFVREVWSREIKKWWPSAAVVHLQGTKTKCKACKGEKVTPEGERCPECSETGTVDLRCNSPATIYVMNYDIAHVWGPLLQRDLASFTIVFDEIHMLMSDRSRRSAACRELARVAKYRIGLSGTPMTSRPRDLWNPVDTLCEGRFGRPFDFMIAHCTPPEAPIWMGDLTFKPIGEVKPGDTVIGWDTPAARPLKVLRGKSFNAPGYKRRKLVRTKVLAVARRQSQIIKVTLASGRVLRCTPDHRWMSGKHSCKRSPWVCAEGGRWLSHVIAPPSLLSEEQREIAHWLGGLFDGEGTAGKTARGHFVSISQSPHHNPQVCAAIERAFEKLKLPFSIHEAKPSGLGRGANIYYLNGGRQMALDFLTWCRPVRGERIIERILGSKIRTPDPIVSVEPDGFGEVVALTTETGNYVVYGYASKNCDAHKETIKTHEGDRVVWNTSGASNLEELQTRLNYFMLRRTKTDVALELPPRTRQIIEVDIGRKFRAEVGSALKSDAALRYALSLAADGKLPQALDMIANHVEAGSKVVAFTHRIIVAEQLAAALIDLKIDAKVITGKVSHKQRAAIVEEKPVVICATLDSTSVGIDLSHADVAVFVELDWVPSKLIQGEGRLHRFGQKNPVLIQYVIALATVDEVIRDAVLAKMEHFERSVGKLDDGLKESLKGPPQDSVATLRRLYEKIRDLQT
jgi:superfamily II DNA or RNA helicase